MTFYKSLCFRRSRISSSVSSGGNRSERTPVTLTSLIEADGQQEETMGRLLPNLDRTVSVSGHDGRHSNSHSLRLSDAAVVNDARRSWRRSRARNESSTKA